MRMRATFQRLLFVLILVFEVTPSYGQCVYKMVSSNGMGYYNAHCIGSEKFAFGYQEYSYTTDAKGNVKPLSMSVVSTNANGILSFVAKPPDPGDIDHRYTRVYLGPATFSVPMRPRPLFLLAVSIALLGSLLTYFAWKRITSEHRMA
jgi:hypothetical protein